MRTLVERGVDVEVGGEGEGGSGWGWKGDRKETKTGMETEEEMWRCVGRRGGREGSGGGGKDQRSCEESESGDRTMGWRIASMWGEERT